MSIAKRAIPSASSVDEANQIVRGNWLQAIESHHQKHSGNSTIREILDIGCSVGVSTRFLADKFPSAKVTGLDLSPYFLAVAQYKDNKMNQGTEPIRWIHGNGENTGLPSKSFDLVSIAYVFHECPERAIKNMVKEAFRLLRPGGTFAITDNSPKSKILQELSPVLFTLMKSTEPFLDEYYLTDLEGTLQQVGFVNVQFCSNEVCTPGQVLCWLQGVIRPSGPPRDKFVSWALTFLGHISRKVHESPPPFEEDEVRLILLRVEKSFWWGRASPPSEKVLPSEDIIVLKKEFGRHFP
ncbi:UNVERIFIED_CONTAM: Arsenite methyltransferase [Sesamum calycinum]|uniref:Arsenite methyltransferase n=1 Tax=Sesamum calycinum TaxID=2727403 RepID=A0AAW2MA04_9LAMI